MNVLSRRRPSRLFRGLIVMVGVLIIAGLVGAVRTMQWHRRNTHLLASTGAALEQAENARPPTTINSAASGTRWRALPRLAETQREAGHAVVEAGLPAPPRNATEARLELLREVRQTGASAAPWTTEAVDVLGSALASLPESLRGRVRAEGISCYGVACTMDIVFRDGAAVRQLDEVLFAPASKVSHWDGTKYRSPVAPDGAGEGSGVGTLILFKKQSSQNETQEVSR